MARLQILDVPEDTWWDARKSRPRVVERQDYSLSPCTRCSAPCCAAEVRLTVVELLRMSFTLAVEPELFARAVPYVEGEHSVRNGWPAKLADASGDVVKMQLRLRHANGGCHFAFWPGVGRVRCGAWSLRPGACRVYPFRVRFDGRTLSVGSEKLCPIRWLQNDDTRARLRADLDAWMADLDDDKRIVSRWNRGRRKDRSEAAFLEWLTHTVGPDLGYDPALLEAMPERKLGPKLW